MFKCLHVFSSGSSNKAMSKWVNDISTVNII